MIQPWATTRWTTTSGTEWMTEHAVNETLPAFHDDVAALRRFLVDEGLLDRDHGMYWRSGGRTDPPAEPAAGSEDQPTRRSWPSQ
jgi:Uncharacterized protein conserved in bacteria (DUF2087)